MPLSRYIGSSAPGVLSFADDSGKRIDLPENPETQQLAKTLQSQQAMPTMPIAPVRGGLVARPAMSTATQVVPGREAIAGALGGTIAPMPVAAPPVAQFRSEAPVDAARSVPARPAQRPVPPRSAAPAAPAPAAQPGEQYDPEGLAWQAAQQPPAAAAPTPVDPNAPPSGLQLGAETRKLGLQLDRPDFEGRMIDRRLAAQQQYDANRAGIEAEQQAARDEAEILRQQAEETAQRKRRWAEELAAREADRRDTQDAVDSQEIDADRIFKGRPVARFMAAIASGLGAYAAIMGRTRNFALDTLNGAIDRDIASQRAELAKRQKTADKAANAYDALLRAGRTPELAESELRLIALRQAGNRLKQLRASSQLLQNDAQLAEKDVQIEQLHEAEVANHQKLTQNETAQQFLAPKPVAMGGGGGISGKYRPYFEEENELEQFRNLSSQQKAELALKYKEDVNKYSKKLEKVDDVTGTLREFEQLIAQEARKQGAKVEDADLPGVGFGHTLLHAVGADTISAALAGPQGRRIQNLQYQLVQKMTTAITGAVASEEQVKQFKKILGQGSIFEGDLVQGIQNFKALLSDVNDSARRSTPAIVRVIHREQHGGGRGYLDPRAGGKFEPAR